MHTACSHWPTTFRFCAQNDSLNYFNFYIFFFSSSLNAYLSLSIISILYTHAARISNFSFFFVSFHFSNLLLRACTDNAGLNTFLTSAIFLLFSLRHTHLHALEVAIGISMIHYGAVIWWCDCDLLRYTYYSNQIRRTVSRVRTYIVCLFVCVSTYIVVYELFI